MTRKAPNIVEVEFVDYGVQGEFGMFGKVVAKAQVEGMTEAEVAAEVAAVQAIVGQHVAPRYVESVGGAQ